MQAATLLILSQFSEFFSSCGLEFLESRPGQPLAVMILESDFHRREVIYQQCFLSLCRLRAQAQPTLRDPELQLSWLPADLAPAEILKRFDTVLFVPEAVVVLEDENGIVLSDDQVALYEQLLEADPDWSDAQLEPCLQRAGADLCLNLATAEAYVAEQARLWLRLDAAAAAEAFAGAQGAGLCAALAMAIWRIDPGLGNTEILDQAMHRFQQDSGDWGAGLALAMYGRFPGSAPAHAAGLAEFITRIARQPFAEPQLCSPAPAESGIPFRLVLVLQHRQTGEWIQKTTEEFQAQGLEPILLDLSPGISNWADAALPAAYLNPLRPASLPAADGAGVPSVQTPFEPAHPVLQMLDDCFAAETILLWSADMPLPTELPERLREALASRPGCLAVEPDIGSNWSRNGRHPLDLLADLKRPFLPLIFRRKLWQMVRPTYLRGQTRPEAAHSGGDGLPLMAGDVVHFSWQTLSLGLRIRACLTQQMAQMVTRFPLPGPELSWIDEILAGIARLEVAYRWQGYWNPLGARKQALLEQQAALCDKVVNMQTSLMASIPPLTPEAFGLHCQLLENRWQSLLAAKRTAAASGSEPGREAGMDFARIAV